MAFLIRVSRVRTPEGALRTLFLRTLRLPRGRCFFVLEKLSVYAGLRALNHLLYASKKLSNIFFTSSKANLNLNTMYSRYL